MKRKVRNWSGARLGTSLLVLAAGLSACAILDEGGTPANARITLEGGGGESIELITSNDFAIISEDEGETNDVFMYSADTVTVSSPFDQRYPLGPGIRFFVQASSESALSQPVTMRVFVGGERRYNVSSTLGGTRMEFVYAFR